MSSETFFISHLLHQQQGQYQLKRGDQAQTPDQPMQSLLEQFSTIFHSRSGRLIGDLASGSACRALESSSRDEFAEITAKLAQKIADLLNSRAEETTEEGTEELTRSDGSDNGKNVGNSDGNKVVMLLVARWRSEQRDRLMFAWVEPVKQWSLDQQGQMQQLNVFGPSSLRFGLHVDFARQQSFALPSRPLKNSDLVLPLLGFEATADSKKETDKFMLAFDSYCQQVDDASEQSEIRQKAYDYCSEQVSQGESVDLRSLSAELNQQSPEKFFDYVGTLEAEIEPSMPLDGRRMKQMIRFSGSMKGISISFSEFMLGEQVIYDSGQESLLVRDLPPTLKKQLKRIAAE